MLAFATSLAMVVGGCKVAPIESGSAPAPVGPKPPDPPSQSQPMHQAESSSDFHANPSERQRFQVRLDFGRIFEKQGSFDAAINEYQEALAVAESKRSGRFAAADAALAERRIAVANDRLGRFAQAEVHYKRALRLAPKDPRVWNDVGYSYYVQGRYPDAERALKTAARLDPHDERARLNLGLTLAASGRPQEALPLLSQAGGDAVGHANLGYLLASTGQHELAKLEYQKALAIRPDLEVARRGLAVLTRPSSDRIAQGPLARTADQNLARTGAAAVESPSPRIPAPRPWSTGSQSQ